MEQKRATCCPSPSRAAGAFHSLSFRVRCRLRRRCHTNILPFRILPWPLRVSRESLRARNKMGSRILLLCHILFKNDHHPRWYKNWLSSQARAKRSRREPPRRTQPCSKRLQEGLKSIEDTSKSASGRPKMRPGNLRQLPRHLQERPRRPKMLPRRIPKGQRFSNMLPGDLPRAVRTFRETLGAARSRQELPGAPRSRREPLGALVAT